MKITSSSFTNISYSVQKKLLEPILVKIKHVHEVVKFKQKLESSTPVIIYQMGKVGSSSIYYSLLDQYHGVVVHSHDFSTNSESWKVQKLYNLGVVEKKPLKIISLVREPVGRNISAFFQNFERTTGVSYTESHFSLDELFEIFLSKFNHEYPLEWFDRHIYKNFGIDVYKSKFNDKGYSKYGKNNFQLLVIRLENEDKINTNAINDFLGISQFELMYHNIGSEKDYATTYNEFKKIVSLPKNYIEKMYDSRYFNYFYTTKMKDKYRRKWEK